MSDAPSTQPVIPTVPHVDTQGVLGRRVVAWLIDAVLVGVLMVALHLVMAILGLVTFGLGWALLGLLPVVPFLYSFGLLASPRAATVGQAMMHLTVVEHMSGRRPSPLEAFVSTVLFYVSLTFSPLFLVALVTPRHRTLHDLCSGLLVVHQQVGVTPLDALRYGAWNMPAGSATGGTTA